MIERAARGRWGALVPRACPKFCSSATCAARRAGPTRARRRAPGGFASFSPARPSRAADQDTGPCWPGNGTISLAYAATRLGSRAAEAPTTPQHAAPHAQPIFSPIERLTTPGGSLAKAVRKPAANGSPAPVASRRAPGASVGAFETACSFSPPDNCSPRAMRGDDAARVAGIQKIQRSLRKSRPGEILHLGSRTNQHVRRGAGGDESHRDAVPAARRRPIAGSRTTSRRPRARPEQFSDCARARRHVVVAGDGGRGHSRADLARALDVRVG